MATQNTCSACGGDGIGGENFCVVCMGTGATPVKGINFYLKTCFSDIEDKLNDILDKCNDIFEQVNP